MKKVIAVPLAWMLDWYDMKDDRIPLWWDALYAIYSTLMGWSFFIDRWAGHSVWFPCEDEIE